MKKYDLIFIFFASAALLLIGIFLAVPATPSDPLQYIGPALSPENGFPFFDRIFLWLWIRLFTTFSFSAEYVGAYATLAQVIITYLISSFWLSYRFGSLSVILFSFLFFGSTAWLSIITYTYPMQALTMFVVISLILFDILKIRGGFFSLGVGFALSIFSKVQGFGFVSGLVYSAYHSFKNKNFSPLIYWSYGFLIIFIGLNVFLYIDGNPLSEIVQRYFQENHNAQMAGRAAGGMPKWHYLLAKPAYLCSFFGLFLFFLINKKSPIFIFSMVGFFQLFLLLLIYFITDRGGPVIENYVLDSFTLGAIAFSAVAGSFLSRKADVSVSFIFITVIVFIASIVQYTFTYIDFGLLVSFFTTSLIFYYLVPFVKKKSVIYVLYPFVFIFFNQLHAHGIEGIKKTERRIRWVDPYYSTVHHLLDKEKKFVVDVDFGYGNSNASSRIKRIARQIYSTDLSKNTCFNENCAVEPSDYFLTNKNFSHISLNLPLIASLPIDGSSGFNLNFDQINSTLGLPIRNNGSRGVGNISYNADSNLFVIEPDGSAVFTADFNVGKQFSHLFQENQVYILRGISTYKKKSLFVQYYTNGKSVRRYGDIFKDVHVLKFSVPSGAEKISFGWYFDGFTDTLNFSGVDIKDARSLSSDRKIYIFKNNEYYDKINY